MHEVQRHPAVINPWDVHFEFLYLRTDYLRRDLGGLAAPLDVNSLPLATGPNDRQWVPSSAENVFARFRPVP